MNKKGFILVGEIFALLFIPGTIPAYIAMKTIKFKKRLTAQNIVIEG